MEEKQQIENYCLEMLKSNPDCFYGPSIFIDKDGMIHGHFQFHTLTENENPQGKYVFNYLKKKEHEIQLKERLENSFKAGKTFKFELDWKFNTNDDNILVSLKPVFKEGEVFCCLLSFLLDYQLRSNLDSEIFHEFFENSNEAMIIRNLEDKEIEYISPAFTMVFGLSREKLEKDPMAILEITHKDDKKKIEHIYQEIQQKGKTDTYEIYYRIQKEDNQEHWIHEKGFLIRSTHYNANYIGIIASDISQIRQLQKQIQESNLQYRTIVEQTIDPIFLIETKTMNIAMSNPAASNVLGYSEEEFKELHYPDFDKYMKNGNLKTILKGIQESGSGTFESVWTSKTGEPINTMISIRIINMENKSYFLAVCRENTEQKRIEARLQQAERLKSIGQLAAGISHQFNNILAGITGYADMLLESLPDHPVYQKYTRRILEATNRAVALNTKILAFAEMGKYHNQIFPINEIIIQSLDFMSIQSVNQINISTDLDPGRGQIKGDPAQIQSSIHDIITNAIESMPTGGNLYIRSAKKELTKEEMLGFDLPAEDGNYLEILIQDNGRGITSSIRKYIFEPFFSTKPLGEGTGMSLAAVYGIVKKHKGAINVLSEEKKGTSFYLYLPLIEDKTKSKNQEINIDLSNHHILLIDDEEIMLEMITSMLRHIGVGRISVCSNSEEAVRLYRRQWQDIDIVIIDMLLPYSNGASLFKSMKEINSDILAILATGSDITTEIERFYKMGFKKVLRKPFKKAVLAEILYTVLQKTDKN